jgi:hypothetical protein
MGESWRKKRKIERVKDRKGKIDERERQRECLCEKEIVGRNQ